MQRKFITRLPMATNVKQVLSKVIWEECVALTQLQKNVPIGYNGMPKIHPQKYLFP